MHRFVRKSTLANLKGLFARGSVVAILASGAIGISAGLALSSGATPVLAFNCGANTGSHQWDIYHEAYGHYMHGWLGYCAYSNGTNTWYAGQDSRTFYGGSYYNVSSMEVHMIVDNTCTGAELYNQSITYYNSAYQELETDQPLNGCPELSAGASGYQTVNGEFTWNWSQLS